jgi:hypothetical protein
MLNTLSRTWEHLFRRTLAALDPPAAIALLWHTPALVDHMARVERLALTGDVLATQQACQAWNKAVKQAVQEGKP